MRHVDLSISLANIRPLQRVVQTCVAAPSQWDAWTEDGHYLYLRYRHSQGRVEWHPSPDVDTWKTTDPVLIRWEDPRRDADDYVGNPMIELHEFLERAGLQLGYGAEVVPWEWPEDDEPEISNEEHEATRERVFDFLARLAIAAVQRGMGR